MRWSWEILGAVVIIAASFVVADGKVRQAPHGGFLPADTDWAVVTDDLPGVWAGATDTEFYRALTQEVRSPLYPAQLRLRTESGMRLTPPRWRLWIGDAFAGAAWGEEHVIVVHPGILPRVLEPLVRTVRGFTESGGIVEADGGYYAWREGFCIVSRSRELVEACLREDAVRLEKPGAERSLQWRGRFAERAVELALRPVDQIPMELSFDGFEDHPGMPDRVAPGPWPDEIARMDGLTLGAIRDLVETAATYWSRRTQEQVHEVLAALPREAAYTSVVLADIAVGDARVVVEPHVFMTIEPAADVPVPLDTIPTYWGHLDGWMLPWWGESFTLCHARDGAHAYYASRQTVMAGFLDAAQAREPAMPGRIYINWTHLAEKAEHAALQAADFELIEGHNRQDAGGRIVPYIRAAALLGETLVTGTVENGRLVLRGNLASPIVVGEDAE